MKHVRLFEDYSTPYTDELKGIKPEDITNEVFSRQAKKYIALGKSDELNQLIMLFSDRIKKSSGREMAEMVDILGKVVAEATGEGIDIPGFNKQHSDSTMASARDRDSALKNLEILRMHQESKSNIGRIISLLYAEMEKETNKAKSLIGSDYGGELGKYYNAMADQVIKALEISKYGGSR